MATLGSTVIEGRKGYAPIETTFRDHAYKAYVRPAANMDEEAAIMAAGADAKTKSIRNYSALLQEYCRRLVREISVTAPDEDPDDVEPITGHELAEAIAGPLSRDSEYCWMLYVWLGVQDITGTSGREELVEAVEKKRTGSSTKKEGTPSPKPESSAASSEEKASATTTSTE